MIPELRYISTVRDKTLNAHENIAKQIVSLKKDRTRGHEETLVKYRCRLDIRYSLSHRTINERKNYLHIV